MRIIESSDIAFDAFRMCSWCISASKAWFVNTFPLFTISFPPTNTNVCALHRVEVSKIMRTFFWQEHTLTLCFVCLVETCFLNKNKILSCSCSNTTIAFALTQKHLSDTRLSFFLTTQMRGSSSDGVSENVALTLYLWNVCPKRLLTRLLFCLLAWNGSS